jgi:hypothetical protein
VPTAAAIGITHSQAPRRKSAGSALAARFVSPVADACQALLAVTAASSAGMAAKTADPVARAPVASASGAGMADAAHVGSGSRQRHVAVAHLQLACAQHQWTIEAGRSIS